jgi:hypothetical protein
MAEKEQAFESVTLGHMRAHGCRDLLIYCEAINCHNRSIMNADHLPDECRSARYVREWSANGVDTAAPTCGRIGAR